MVKKKFGNLALSLAAVLIVLVVFSSSLGPLPSLGNFLNPEGGGIIDVGTTANYASMQELTNIPELQSNVTIYRDAYGIPHIYANKDNDMFFAVGYVQAQDRLFQMDIQRRLFSGNLSIILGNVTLQNDIFFRSVGLERSAQQLYNALQTQANTDQHIAKMLQAMNAYSEGINYYIAHLKVLPFEFQLLGYKPYDWTPVDSLAFAKYMSFSLGFGEGEYDLKFVQVLDSMGAQKAYDLFPFNQSLQIPVVPDYGGYQMPSTYSFTSNGSTSQAPLVTNKTIPSNQLMLNQIAGAAKNVDNVLQNVYTNFGGMIDQFKGSNNWVISGNKSATGHPILSNDMHLQWSTPSIWYQMDYHSKESNLNVWGFVFIGSPFIVAGHNQKIAWGFTNVGGDVLDWYYFNTKGDQYYSNNAWQNYTYVNQTIKVKGASDFHLTTRLTDVGPIIPGADYAYKGMQLAVSWTGIKTYKQLGDQAVLKAIYDFGYAQNYTAFQNAVYEWDSPSQNIVYADSSNIAITVAGAIPIRDSGNNGRIPQNGSATNTDWLGYVNPHDWPHSLNPAQGYLASDNQKSTGPNYPYYIGSYQDPGYRARRINYLLHTTNDITIAKMEKIQTDVLDTSAQAFVPYLEEALAMMANGSVSFNIPSNLQTVWNSAVTVLKNWNDYMFANESAPLIYEFFMNNYMPYTFQDEYKQAGLENSSIPYPNLNFLDNLTWKNPYSHWFDNVSTPNVKENAFTIMLQSFSDALASLQSKYGSEVSSWTYGTWHKGSFDSLTGLAALSPAHMPINGSSYTLNPSSGGRIANHGPSERAIYDLSNLSNSVAALPGGQSGNPVSKHYDDLLQNYFLPWKYYPQLFFQDRLPKQYVESTITMRGTS